MRAAALMVLAVAGGGLQGSPLDYAGLAGLAAFSWIGVSGPGEAALIAAGIAAARGRLDLPLVVAVAFAGATFGGAAGWMIGHHGGRRLFLAGEWLQHHRLRIMDHGGRFFERFGLLAMPIAPSWAAGLNAMRPSVFMPANAIWAALWSTGLGVGAFFVGPSVGDIAADVGIYTTIAIVVLIAVMVLVGRWRLRAHRRAHPHPPH